MERPQHFLPCEVSSVTPGGPVWGAASEDLNATVLEWPAGGGTDEHVNAERDVVLVVLAGTAEVELDGKGYLAGRGEVLVLEKGRRRRITAGPEGVRYLTVHRKRPGLAIGSRGDVDPPA